MHYFSINLASDVQTIQSLEQHMAENNNNNNNNKKSINSVKPAEVTADPIESKSMQQMARVGIKIVEKSET